MTPAKTSRTPTRPSCATGWTVGGDPLPYGIDANRTTMEAIIQACLDQKVIPNRVAVEDVFAASTVNLA